MHLNQGVRGVFCQGCLNQRPTPVTHTHCPDTPSHNGRSDAFACPYLLAEGSLLAWIVASRLSSLRDMSSTVERTFSKNTLENEGERLTLRKDLGRDRCELSRQSIQQFVDDGRKLGRGVLGGMLHHLMSDIGISSHGGTYSLSQLSTPRSFFYLRHVVAGQIHRSGSAQPIDA
jgi:hypothetical protein